MARKKTPQEDPGEHRPEGAGQDGEKYTASVKFTKTFKARLERVADNLGHYPGQLVEMHMKKFIDREWLRILEEDLAKARKEAGQEGHPKA